MLASSVQTCIDDQVGYLPESAAECVKITELAETCQYHATETELALLCEILTGSMPQVVTFRVAETVKR